MCGAHHDTHDDDDSIACQDAHGDTDESACQDAHGDTDESARHGARGGGRGGGRGGWAVNPVLIIPWDPTLGQPAGDAEIPGYGRVDPQATMDLLDAAAGNPLVPDRQRAGRDSSRARMRPRTPPAGRDHPARDRR
jgi:hypothetical protein